MADPFSTPSARAARGKQLDENGIERNQWGQPVIDGSAYVRATTMAKTLADEYNLTAWKLRMLAKGIATGRDDLYKLASISDTDTSVPGTVKMWESEIIEPALDRAGANAGRKTGTALHVGTHKLDRGDSLSNLPVWMRDSLETYAETLDAAGITIDPAHIEIFTVCTEIGSAGTADRLLGHPTWPKLRVGDLKCQKDHPQEFNAMDIAIQEWIYAEGLNTKGVWRVDDLQTGEGHWDTSTVGRVDTERGVIMWLPHEGPNAGECHLIEIDLVRGRTLARMAERIRAERKAAKTLVRPLAFAAPATTEVTVYQNSGASVKIGETIVPSGVMITVERNADAVDVSCDSCRMYGAVLDRQQLDEWNRVHAHPAAIPAVHAQSVADKIDAAFPLDGDDVLEPVIDFAGKQCPDGRVHGAHDGCPGRKRRSPAQIAADAERERQSQPGVAAETALAALNGPIDGLIVDSGSDERGNYVVLPDGQKRYVEPPLSTYVDEQMIEAMETENVVDVEVSGVRFRVRVTPDWIESVCEHGDGMMRHERNEDAPLWRKNHAELKHPHVLLEAAQQPVAGPGIDAARLAETANVVLDRLHEQRTGEPAATVDPVIALRARIRQCTEGGQLSELWRAHSTIWTDELTKLGQEVMAGLPR